MGKPKLNRSDYCIIECAMRRYVVDLKALRDATANFELLYDAHGELDKDVTDAEDVLDKIAELKHKS